MKKSLYIFLFVILFLIVTMNNNVTFCNLKEGETLIADSEFVSCDKINEINLPEGLQYIGENVFYQETSSNINNTEHNYQYWITNTEPTCTTEDIEKKICSDCTSFESRSFEVLIHPYGEKEILQIPTFTKNGVEGSACENCGDLITNPIDKINPTGYIIIGAVATRILVASIVLCIVIFRPQGEHN